MVNHKPQTATHERLKLIKLFLGTWEGKPVGQSFIILAFNYKSINRLVHFKIKWRKNSWKLDLIYEYGLNEKRKTLGKIICS